jgi:hypothetical protein
MNQYQNEDMAWLRLQDLQREVENRRIAAGGSASTTIEALRRVLGRGPSFAKRGSKVRDQSA